MITGRVIGLNIMVPVMFRLHDGSEHNIEFVVDTGFTGALTLPAKLVTELKLRYVRDVVSQLANDDEVATPVYEAAIIWNGVVRRVAVLETGSRPLVGTALLDGTRMTIEFAEKGLVTIDDL